MGKFKVEVTEKARQDISKHLKAGNKATIKKIETLLIELSENPYQGTGQPEALKHELKGFWSRRINQKDRLIYSVFEEIVTVEVVSAIGHYNAK